MPRSRVVVCLKWADPRPEVDPLTGGVRHDPHAFGASAAEEAALEGALIMGERWDADVEAVTVGPPAATEMLRAALAVGATGAIRIDGTGTEASDVVAAALAREAVGARLVWCGDRSADRGSGSVPAFLAAYLDLPQALGVARVDLRAAQGGSAEAVEVERRIEGGRRERLLLEGPGVVSVEAGTARLRRAALPAVLAAAASPVLEVAHTNLDAPGGAIRRGGRRAFRPRPVLRPAPSSLSPLLRISELAGVLVERTPPRVVLAGPQEGADAVLEQLRTWGYLPAEA